MQLTTKSTLLEFSKTPLATKFFEQVERLTKLYQSDSAVALLGKRTTLSLLCDAGTKVHFSQQDTVNSVSIKALNALQLVVLESEEKLKKIKEDQSAKAIKTYQNTYSFSAVYTEKDRASIVSLWQTEQKEINTLAELLFKARRDMAMMNCLRIVDVIVARKLGYKLF